MTKLTAYASHPSTRRSNEFTTWFRMSITIGVCLLTNSGWMETISLVPVGTVVELPDNAVRFQPETFEGKEGEQITCNHIVSK
jgi:hypothetical protein